MNLRPLHDYLLVKFSKPSSTVFKEADVEDTLQRGEVIAAGPGVYHHSAFVEPSAKPGDKIIFQKFKHDADTPPDILDKGCCLIRDIHVMAVEDGS